MQIKATVGSQEKLKSRRQITSNVGEELGQMELSCISGVSVKWNKDYKELLGGCYEVKHTSALDPEIPLLRIIPIKMDTYGHKRLSQKCL